MSSTYVSSRYRPRSSGLVGRASERDGAVVYRGHLRLVETLISHRDTIQAHTGLPVDVVLSQQGRLTRSDRRMLIAGAETLAVLPQIRDTWRAGGQLRVWARTARKLVREFDVDVRLLLIGEHGDTIGVGRNPRPPTTGRLRAARPARVGSRRCSTMNRHPIRPTRMRCGWRSVS